MVSLTTLITALKPICVAEGFHKLMHPEAWRLFQKMD